MSPRTPLRVYAAMTVGEHVGVPRADMLIVLNMTEPDWEAERAAWSREIADRLAADDDAFMQQHDAAILEARQKLGRSVEPLESDDAAWGAFLGHWSRATEPGEWVQSIGLTWLDVTRLQGIWSQRLAKSEPLRKSMLQRMVTDPAPLPSLTIGPWPVASAFAGLAELVAASSAVETSGPETQPEDAIIGDAAEPDAPIFEPLPEKVKPVTGRSSDRLKS